MCRGGNVTGNVAESGFRPCGEKDSSDYQGYCKLCGVSVSTVSRVINDRPDVSPEVRAAVLEAVRSSNYVPNNSARVLGSSSSDAIGLVVRGLANPFYSPIIKVSATGSTPRLYDGDAADRLNGG